jgi:hypothetical protein
MHWALFHHPRAALGVSDEAWCSARDAVNMFITRIHSAFFGPSLLLESIIGSVALLALTCMPSRMHGQVSSSRKTNIPDTSGFTVRVLVARYTSL